MISPVETVCLEYGEIVIDSTEVRLWPANPFVACFGIVAKGDVFTMVNDVMLEDILGTSEFEIISGIRLICSGFVKILLLIQVSASCAVRPSNPMGND